MDYEKLKTTLRRCATMTGSFIDREAFEEAQVAIESLQAKVAELDAMLARKPCQNNRCIQFADLEKEKQRMDWLEDWSSTAHGLQHRRGEALVIGSDTGRWCYGKTLREAIDIARTLPKDE